MYRNFFSLSDLPFSISPDPKYLFMSDRHREALSHLTYGLGEVGGFALLTGEVGTGKTTISRCLMEQLPDNTQAAFILNPTLSSQELLATLCDELNIIYDKTDATLKNLTDKISEKLLQNHENDINTLLIIDEAQHLQPEVLEQLRLLTNLETNTKKLLQVILIGQPELQQLLQRRDLRQLAQRITARYHLMPLTKQELNQYIQHRLNVADCARPLFNKGALDKIHELSQGIPRLTNLLCHSALMLAYNQNDSVVNKKTVVVAGERALGLDFTTKSGRFNYNNALVLTASLSVAAFIALAGFWWGQTQVSVKVINALPNEPSLKVNSTTPDINIEEASNKKFVDKVSMELDIDSAVDKNQATQDSLPRENTDFKYGFYTVRSGDTLFKLSVKYNVKLNALREWNNIKEKNSIEIGDRLYIVNPNLGTQSYTAQVQKNNQHDQTHIVSGEKSNRTPKSHTDINYQVTQVDGVSSDLLARFQDAIDETEAENPSRNNTQRDFYSKEEQSEINANDSNYSNFNNDTTDIKPLTQMPQTIQDALPSLQFEQHIYSSDGQGWVTVNGRDRYEGDYINDELRVYKILPQKVIMSFRGENFSLPALTNW